ncbi:MAG TPA: diguanylate cyclase [Pseudonocardiaceae bacterium]|nr:diguanylate cyclase [Pseudonocardiaceae bacterium]
MAAPELPAGDREARRLLEAGQIGDANFLLDKVVGAAPADDPYSRASTLINRAITAWRLGRIPLALELAAEGWTDLSALPQEGPTVASTISQLGYLLGSLGNDRAALETMRTAVRLAREAGDTVILAACLQRLGGLLNFRAIDGPAEQARATFEQARALLAEGLALDAEARMHRGLLGAYGRSLAGLGELTAAAEAGRQVLALGTKEEDLWAQGVGEWVLATVNQARGKREQARTLAARAVSKAERINDTALLLRFSQDLANICADLDDPVGEAEALRRTVSAALNAADTLREGLAQALERRRLAVQAQRLATAAQEAAARDPLTGLANRLGLESSAPAMLAAATRGGRMPWLVLIDVDWFKNVNDDAGHAAGDAALREIAQLLRNECRSEDLVARWAGDEFVVLLGDASNDKDAGPMVAERIRVAVADHDWTTVLGSAQRPTVSVGVASGPTRLDELFAAADVVLYQAKRQGRNRVAVYQEVAGVSEFST